ncbi:hypothetical protein [Flavobacterium ardleyense]|uniref:hypothetical protein n=1 Tax=Flavobacterium ardleyense TaxID=2038737 RepID=UPI00298D0823|nr:hypothetical protein [Flavobacterium ardleyense]
MKKIVSITILLLLFCGCISNLSTEEFEQKVFDELFITIVDSTYRDQRLYTCFPEKGEMLYDKNGRWKGFDTIGQYQRDLECEVKRLALKSDTINLVIAIENEGLINEETNLSKYNTLKFIFKHLSEQPRDADLKYTGWKKSYAKFAGVMSFSSIKFDDKKETGTIDVSYSCGDKCGLGYLVYLKKSEGKWIISKVEETWIS